MRTRICTLALCLLVSLINAQEAILGFTPENAKKQHELDYKEIVQRHKTEMNDMMSGHVAEFSDVAKEYDRQLDSIMVDIVKIKQTI